MNSRFYAQLRQRSNGRYRITLDVIWRAFREVYPDDDDSLDRQRLVEALAHLQQDERVHLPRGRHGWNQQIQPPLPLWIGIPANRSSSNQVDHRNFDWCPELQFVKDIDYVDVLTDLVRIHEFLENGGRARPVIPIRERSVELFGDVKRLESLARSRFFRAGRLSLDTLRCRQLHPPLVWKQPTQFDDRPHQRPAMLIVESHQTFWSLCQWNEQRALYGAVIYGGGDDLKRSAGYLAEIRREVDGGQIDFFGSLDPASIRHAINVSAQVADFGVPELARPCRGTSCSSKQQN